MLNVSVVDSQIELASEFCHQNLSEFYRIVWIMEMEFWLTIMLSLYSLHPVAAFQSAPKDLNYNFVYTLMLKENAVTNLANKMMGWLIQNAHGVEREVN